MIVAPHIIEELEKIQQDILGDETLITKDPPIQNQLGEYVGGVQFERNDWIHGVKDTRCYTIGPSHQHSKSLVSPNACGKVMDEEMNDDHHLRHRLLKVMSFWTDILDLLININFSMVEWSGCLPWKSLHLNSFLL